MTLSKSDVEAMVERAVKLLALELAYLEAVIATRDKHAYDQNDNVRQRAREIHAFITSEALPALAAALLADRRAMEALLAADSNGVTHDEAALTDEYIGAVNALRRRLAGWDDGKVDTK